ncbi:MAG: DinB family protein [Planctomycetota bacterium]
MSDLENLIRDIRRARMYTKDILSHIDLTDWFRQPDEGVTHVAWQVGHLAATQYALTLKRLRGEKADDAEMISPELRRLFGKGSRPVPDPGSYPTPKDLRAVFDRVHEQVLDESSDWSKELLDEATSDPPHPMFKTKGGAIRWSVQHEFIHIGQIGLLRRLLGATPLW